MEKSGFYNWDCTDSITTANLITYLLWQWNLTYLIFFFFGVLDFKLTEKVLFDGMVGMWCKFTALGVLVV